MQIFLKKEKVSYPDICLDADKAEWVMGYLFCTLQNESALAPEW